MQGFFSFNQNNKYYKMLQAYNLYCAFYASLDYFTNPDAQFSEMSADLLIHLWTAYSLQASTLDYTNMLSVTLNSARLGSIYTSITTGVGTLSTPIDALVHLANFTASSLNFGSDEEEHVEPQATAK
jgi:hypothetical protein